MATAQGDDIVDCASTAFIRLNNDSGRSRTHVRRDRVYEVGIDLNVDWT
jgi:hypothetical protein